MLCQTIVVEGIQGRDMHISINEMEEDSIYSLIAHAIVACLLVLLFQLNSDS